MAMFNKPINDKLIRLQQLYEALEVARQYENKIFGNLFFPPEAEISVREEIESLKEEIKGDCEYYKQQLLRRVK